AMPCSCLVPSNQSGIWMLNRSRSTTLPAVSRAISSRNSAAVLSVADRNRFIGMPDRDEWMRRKGAVSAPLPPVRRSPGRSLVQRALLLELRTQGLERGLAVVARLAGRLDPARVQRLRGVAPGLVLRGRELVDRVAALGFELLLARVL